MTLRNAQLTKELRPLLLPWFGAVAAGCLIGLKPLLNLEVLESLLTVFIVYGFFGGLSMVATLGIGQELQEKTMPLLLSQPLSRSRIWWQKMLLTTVAVVAATLVEIGLLVGISNWYDGDQVWEAVRSIFDNESLFMAGCFLLATVCSCGYWTLVAGSVLGGLVFNVTGQFLCAIGVILGWAWLRGEDRPFQDSFSLFVLAVVALIYCGLFLWLGRRQFVRLEVKARSPGTGTQTSLAIGRKMPWAKLLVCRSNGAVLNLVRKELHLQKPVVLLAGAFILCWVASVLLQWLRPAQDLTPLFNVITCLYAPLTSLLSGCISLGEEKALGLTVSQLTLPFSPRLQWLLKLAVSGTVALILSLGVPIVLFYVTGGRVLASGLLNGSDNGLEALASISGLLFLLGFWAISLASNTLRAALIAIAGLIGLPALFALGIYWASLAIVTRQVGGEGHFWIIVIGAAIFMLGQSLVRFCTTDQSHKKLFSYSFALVALVLFASFWVTCFG